MGILKKKYRIEMNCGETWVLPVAIIAENRARYYANTSEFGGDFKKSLEDTIALFESDNDEIEDWAKNNIEWDEVKAHAVKTSIRNPIDYDHEWSCGDVFIED